MAVQALSTTDKQLSQHIDSKTLPCPITIYAQSHRRATFLHSTTRPKPPTLLLLLLTQITLLILLFSTSATAQTPTPRRRTAYVQSPTSNNTRLYIQGGLLPVGYSSELNELDLTKPWTTASPAWALLPPGDPNYHHVLMFVKPEHSAGLYAGSAGGITSSLGYLFAIGGNTVPSVNFWAYYNIESRQWHDISTPPSSPAPFTGLEGQTAVTDPATGLIYMIGGFWNLNGTLPTTVMINNFLTVIDPTSGVSGVQILEQQPATGLNNLTGAVAVWSTLRKSVLVFGGSRAVTTWNVIGLGLGTVNEYDPVRKSWGTMVTTGSIPTPRLDACAAASDSGSKVVIFGGELDVDNWLSSIYILDVATRVWTQGPSAPAPQSQAACGFHDGQFVVIGGTGSRNMTEDMRTSQPLVFNVDTNLWISQFTPTSLPTPSPSNSGNGSSGDQGGTGGGGLDEGGQSISTAAKIGGAIGGAVAFMGCIAGIIFVVRKRRLGRRNKRRDVFLAGDKRTQGPDAVVTALPRETAAFMNNNSHQLAGRRSDDSNHGNNDEEGHQFQRRPQSLPSDYYPYKGLATTEHYPTTAGTGTPSAVSAIEDPSLIADSVVSSSWPTSDAASTVAESSPSTFYYKQMQQQLQYPSLRTSTYTPKTSFTPLTPSSPTYSEQTESTAFGYSSTLNGNTQKSPSPTLPILARPPIPARPISAGAMDIYTMNNLDDKLASAPAQIKEQQQPQKRVVSGHAPQFRGEEHAQFQELLDQQHSQPYVSQYHTQSQQQYQQQQHPYQAQTQQPDWGVSQGHPTTEQYRHSTSTMSRKEDGIQGHRHPSIDGYNEFHGTWMTGDRDGRRRYAAPHAVVDTPVETHWDYKVEAPRRPQMMKPYE